MLISYDHGMLARDETPYPFDKIILAYFHNYFIN